MTINYTTLLGLAKPVTGTEANAWGDVVNDQITSLVEDAIANAVSISVSAGNVTLSDNDGSTDQARMAILLITGSPGTTRNIVAPSRSKWYIVRNGSDSSVVVKGSATTGVTIASGKTALVFWNGSDFQTAASNNVSLTTEVTGTLPAANGGTGTTTSTGSGSVVLSTSPTLVTPTLGAASATSVALAAGAEGTPSLTATGDANTGMWFPAADTLAWSTGGSERMRVDTSGNVGIGTSSPGNFDTAWQRLVIGGGSGDVGQTIYSGSASIGTMAFADGTSGAQQYAGLIRYLHASDAMTFWANADERMRIDSSGNVGLGVTPSAWGGYTALQVKNTIIGGLSGNNALFGSNTYYNGSDFIYIGTDPAALYRQLLGAHSWLTAPSGTAGNAISFTQAMTLDASGNLGVGETSPTGGRLHVSQSSGSAIFGSTAGGTGYGGSFENIDAGTTKFVRAAGSGGNGVFSAGVGASTQLLLDTSGNLGVGATSPTEKLHVYGSGNVYNLIESTSATGVAVATAYKTASRRWEVGQSPGLGNNNFTIYDATAAAIRVSISTTGNFGIGADAPLSVLHVKSSTGIITSETTAARNSNNNFLSFRDSTGEAGYVGYGGSNPNFYTWNGINGPLLFGTNNVTRAQIAADGAQSSVIPGGSTLYPQFACRAWINFNGTLVTNPASTTGIRGSGNVSSVLDNGAGDYTINFTTAMPDTNYSLAGLCRQPSDSQAFSAASVMLLYSGSGDITTSSCRIRIGSKGNTVGGDSDLVCVQVFR